jgi:soluble P-type ATPase
MSMKRLLLAALLVTVSTACGPRRVDVTTGTQAVTEVALRVTNNLSQPVNVYVVNGDTEIFVKQVAAKSSDQMSVPNIAAGTIVKLKASPVGGGDSYTRDNVTLSGLYEWQVP